MPAITGDSIQAMMLSQRLLERGINAKPIVFRREYMVPVEEQELGRDGKESGVERQIDRMVGLVPARKSLEGTGDKQIVAGKAIAF